jgi:hypothetical protein
MSSHASSYFLNVLTDYSIYAIVFYFIAAPPATLKQRTMEIKRVWISKRSLRHANKVQKLDILSLSSLMDHLLHNASRLAHSKA